MWRPKGVRFQSVAKSWKGEGSRAAKIEASVTSCSLRLLSLPQISALSTCRVVHRGLPQGSRGPHQRSGEKPGCPALRRRLHTLKIALGQLIPTPYQGHLSAGDATQLPLLEDKTSFPP